MVIPLDHITTFKLFTQKREKVVKVTIVGDVISYKSEQPHYMVPN